MSSKRFFRSDKRLQVLAAPYVRRHINVIVTLGPLREVRWGSQDAYREVHIVTILSPCPALPKRRRDRLFRRRLQRKCQLDDLHSFR